jgi:Ca2+-binding RTX toxin-like protein
MIVRNIDTLHEDSIKVDGSSDIYNIGVHGTVIAADFDSNGNYVGAIYEDASVMPSVSNNTYNINGRVIGYALGLDILGSHDRVNIGANGEVSADRALRVGGDATAVTNHGSIFSAREAGLYLHTGEAMMVDNFGTIAAVNAITGDNVDGLTITNEASGQIITRGTAIFNESGPDASNTFINHGLVRALHASYSVFDGSGNIDIVNDGTLKGNVDLGSGEDTIDLRGGTIQGTIFGGFGDDTLITDNADYKLSEDPDSGLDTVRSTVSYTLSANVEALVLIGKANIDGTGTDGADTLVGNDGNNKLSGGAGTDNLFGGKGDDRLIGGADDDIFYFKTGGGHDTIADFTDMQDRIDLSDWQAFVGFVGVMQHAHDQDDGVLIKSGHDSLLIEGMSKADLSNQDFLFTD